MRTKDTEVMSRISDYIGEYYRHNHVSPPVRTVAAEIGLSKSAVHNYLVDMDRRGMLTYKDGEVGGLPKIEKSMGGYFSAPLVGSIRCGDPEKEEEQVEMYVSLPQALFGKGEYYLLRAEGDSMEDAGISDGDLVLIKKQTGCEVGDIVVALDENNENTLKIYSGTDSEGGAAILSYANERVYPGRKIMVSKLVVQGVARHVIRELRHG